MLTKQEIKPKTPSSIREIPIPDYVFEVILEHRRIYEKNPQTAEQKSSVTGITSVVPTYGNPRVKVITTNILQAACFTGVGYPFPSAKKYIYTILFET